MTGVSNLDKLLNSAETISVIEREWQCLGNEFAAADVRMPTKFMAQRRISFHDHVKLLGYLSLDVAALQGDLVEIGVWKGKSLAFLDRLKSSPGAVIGIDPCIEEGQSDELDYFHSQIFPNCILVKGLSNLCVDQVMSNSKNFKLLHIDGNHRSAHVQLDFLFYERFVVPGGYIVFDDYADDASSPEVRPSVDHLRRLNLFADFDILGQIPPFESSFVLRRRPI